MTDSNQVYQRLAKHLSNTRKSLLQVCREHDIDLADIDNYILQGYIDQCSHCNIWSKKLMDDLDGNPICRVCYDVAGL
jgi:hypothetical protein